MGDLDVTEVWEPVYSIKELGPSIGNVQVSYMVSTGEGKDKTYYNVEEYYRMRYTEERLSLIHI